MAADRVPLESTRVDRWLWSVRVFKTRTLATEACRAGHVAVNRTVTKPATPVKAGDVVTIRVDGRDRVLEVVRVIENRVGAPIAGECVVDHSPPAPPRQPSFERDPSAGRPTKRDRRQIDRLRQR
ncbi:MAG TPA: RNA-binding S4 domain-containing protein [Acidimicrobiales bacterium]|nr:RNA-binding S4 domain-containing protein [Acidimicrobiales bacterium]